MTLRISAGTSSDHRVSFSLEGSVRGPWVAVLQTICEEALSKGDQIMLDLAGVSFMDPAGVVLLRNLLGSGIRLVNCSPFTSMQLDGDIGEMRGRDGIARG